MGRKGWGSSERWGGRGGAAVPGGEEGVGQQCQVGRKGWGSSARWGGRGGVAVPGGEEGVGQQ